MYKNLILIIFLILIIYLFFKKEEFVSRIIPNSDDDYNHNIIRYLRYSKVDIINLELSFKDMNQIINVIPKNYNINNLQDFNDILLSEITKEALKLKKYGSKEFKKNQMKIINKNSNKLIYNIEIFRENKYHFFTLQLTILINNNTIKIDKINIIGIALSENLFNYKHNKLTLRNMFNSHKVNQVIKDKLNLKLDYHEDSKHQCFGKNAITKNHCISKDKDGIGIWDKPCINDSECPFYKQNTNYDNQNGKCNNGYCEMPLNVTPIGFKHYKGNPICYNCINTNCQGLKCNECCDDQKNSLIYPKLFSPDYVFENDKFDRDLKNLDSNLII
jgi:hypothetical protein